MTPRKSIAERYANREEYLGRIALAALALVNEGYLLAEDMPAIDATRGRPLRLGNAA